MSNIKRIIAKLDIKGPNLVKGINMEGLRVLGNPDFFANTYYSDGADEIIYHDCVASLYDRNYISEIIKNTSKKLFVPLCVGGGIKNLKDIEGILKSGADKIFLNSAILKSPKFLKDCVKRFGSSTISVGIEANLIENKYYCFYDYGREPTKKLVREWMIQVQEYGAGEIILTSILNEGTGMGYDLNLFNEINDIIQNPLIISGGAGNMFHILEALKNKKISGVCLSSILHYSKITDKNFKFEENNEGNLNFLKNEISNNDHKYIDIKMIKEFLIENKIKVRI